MRHLLAASFLWAFSFGLIKDNLTAADPVAVACARLVLAAAAFAPLLARRRLRNPHRIAALGLGALQFGAMYVLYIAAFASLPAWLVAVFTIFTPLYVTLASDLLARRLRVRHLAAAVLAVAGAALIVQLAMPQDADWRGILLLQGANLCFAAGQVLFPRLRTRAGGHEAVLVAWMYQGAALVTLLALVLRGADPRAGWDGPALLTVLYLGLVPTAVGFYLWNKGATLTTTGVLAGANNLKVPLAVLVSWAVFGEQADYLRAGLGLLVIVAALFLAGRGTADSTGESAG
ncbi:MAG: EamA family transporter [bacterium]|nr:EamA family transporter [bacterium]